MKKLFLTLTFILITTLSFAEASTAPIEYDCDAEAKFIGWGVELQGGNYYEGYFGAFADCLGRQKPL
ncbi:hypothetical protein IX49_08355 [Cellulophaga lytica]|uniref:hypothetical protein n=1 Tax=Cellulophaga lytica TaxID=979 RepID=UPI0004F76331|nr:hypothetical protein [Cellulophaga lytica]AIM60536.1 hypothetical protein IX49_08355 [Cellulophaga lytica]